MAEGKRSRAIIRPIRTELKWNSVNFQLFAESVEEAVKAAPSAIYESSLDSRSTFLNVAMIDAANKTIGKVKCSVNGKDTKRAEERHYEQAG